MTKSASTIAISCGHQALRTSLVFGEPVRSGQRPRLYWCETCGRYRMAGKKATGERAYDFLLALRDEISSRSIVVDVDDSVPAHGLRVIEAFRAKIRRSSGGLS